MLMMVFGVSIGTLLGVAAFVVGMYVMGRNVDWFPGDEATAAATSWKLASCWATAVCKFVVVVLVLVELVACDGSCDSVVGRVGVIVAALT
jgi:heme/copper-type cytochrome/quinol oxidase subunit 2